MKTRIAIFVCMTLTALLWAPISFAGYCDTHNLNCVDAAGMRQGYWEFTAQMLGADEFNNPGKVIMRGEYKDSKRLGCWERNHFDGKVTEYCFEDSSDVAVVSCYYADRNMLFQTRYNGNLHEGPAKIYYPDGGKLMMELTWTNGRICGPMKTYYASGKLYEEGIWAHSGWSGEWTIYNEDGHVMRKANNNQYPICTVTEPME
jgi:antitoxin component YwqK of YwqJK toxin-antitoxin module